MRGSGAVINTTFINTLGVIANMNLDGAYGVPPKPWP